LQAHPWDTLDPQSCQWHLTEDHSFQITLAKAPTSLGSWPYSLQSFALKRSCSDQEHTTEVCNHDKDAFNNYSDALLDSHIGRSHAIDAAFSHAIAEQMSTLPCGPLGQSAFLFPQQGPHCFEFLKKCYNENIPSVHKLVRVAHNLTGILLIEDIKHEVEEEEALAMPPSPSYPLSSFYSLRSLVECVIAGLAAVEHYRFHRGLDAIKSRTACIGFGAGEYAAAVFAGALRLQDALVAVKAHAQAFSNEKGQENSEEVSAEQDQIDDDVQGCTLRVIDTVRAALTGNKKKTKTSTITADNPSTASPSTPATTTKLTEEIEPTIVRSPRLIMYSGADGVVYESNATAILHALPFNVCAAHAVASRRHDVRVALMQQGVAKMKVLVPEDDDYDENDDDNDQEEEENKDGVEEEVEEKVKAEQDGNTLPFE